MAPKSRMIDRIRREMRYYRALLRDPRTPRAARWLIGLGVGYFLMPFDIVPDFLPIIGQLDDLVVGPTLIGLGMLLVPRSVKSDVRRRTRAIRALHAAPTAPILFESEALPNRCGVRLHAIDRIASAADDEDDTDSLVQTLLRRVFEDRIVVMDATLARDIFGEGAEFADGACIRPAAPAEPGTKRVAVEREQADPRLVDMLRAYEALPALFRQRIARLQISAPPRREVAPDVPLLEPHRSRAAFRGIDDSASRADRRRPDGSSGAGLHPLVPVHPVTKRRVLSPALDVCGIAGMPEEFGGELLDALRRHIQRPEFRYEHRYQPGDVVLWDAMTTLNRGDSEALAGSTPNGHGPRSPARSRAFHPSYRVLLRSGEPTCLSDAECPSGRGQTASCG